MTMNMIESGCNAASEMRYNAVKTDVEKAYDLFVEDRSDETFVHVIKVVSAVSNLCEYGCFSEKDSIMLKKQCSETMEMIKLRYLLDGIKPDEMMGC